MPEENLLPVVTKTQIKETLQLEIQKAKYEELTAAVSNLVVTDENYQEVKKNLDQLQAIGKLIDSKHAEGKRQYLDICNEYDAARRDLQQLVNGVLLPAQAKYRTYCKIAADRKMIQDRENQRIESIQISIKNNVISFGRMIADAKTKKSLLDIKRNIEQASKAKGLYHEFVEEAAAKFSPFLLSIDERIKNIKDDVFMAESAEAVQHTAIESASSLQPIIAQEVIPHIKPIQRRWKIEIKDINTTYRQKPDWVTLELNKEKVNEFIKGHKDNKTIPSDDFTTHGVRFFLEEIY